MEEYFGVARLWVLPCKAESCALIKGARGVTEQANVLTDVVSVVLNIFSSQPSAAVELL